MMSRPVPALAWLLLGLAWHPAAPATAGSLVRCDVLATSGRVRASSSALADHLRQGYAASYPSAVLMAASLAGVSASLDSQLHAVEPTYRAFREAWSAFDRAVRRSPLPQDPALAPVLPAYRQGAQELAGLLGCAPPAGGSEMIPCSAIPIAHLLAAAGGDLERYVEGRYGEALPEQVAAARDLARSATALHQVLHDLEIAVPGTRRTFGALETALAGSSLTDTDEPEDAEVKSRLAAVGEAIAALDGFVGSCHEAIEAHDDH